MWDKMRGKFEDENDFKLKDLQFYNDYFEQDAINFPEDDGTGEERKYYKLTEEELIEMRDDLYFAELLGDGDIFELDACIKLKMNEMFEK